LKVSVSGRDFGSFGAWLAGEDQVFNGWMIVDDANMSEEMEVGHGEAL
jgi:hypothetical protein